MSTAGKNIKLLAAGTAVAFVGEAVTTSDDTSYQITDSTKQVLDKTATIYVSVRSVTGDTAEAGTTTTNIELTGHGLEVGDLIVNTTRSNAARLVTAVPDANNITVASVASQTSGDSIDLYPTAASSAYTLNRLTGTATFGSSTSRTVLISGSYLPMSEMTEAKEMSYSLTANNEDITTFGNDYVLRKQVQKDFTASVTQFYVDDTFDLILQNASNFVIEFWIDRNASYYVKAWVVFDSNEVSGSPNSLVEEALEVSGCNDADNRVVSVGTGT